MVAIAGYHMRAVRRHVGRSIAATTSKRGIWQCDVVLLLPVALVCAHKSARGRRARILPMLLPDLRMDWLPRNSAAGTRTRVARVRAEYPNQLDYSGF